MKSFLKFLIMLLAFSLVFTLASCGEDTPPIDEVCEHYDDDEDGFCDECDEEMEEEQKEGVALILEGEVLFEIVLGNDLTPDLRMLINEYLGIVEDEFDIEIPVHENKEGEEAELEVLIGTVTCRGDDYKFDKYSLGMKGYAITALDETKVAVIGGSTESLAQAIEKFFDDYLGINQRIDSLEDFVLEGKLDVIEVQDDYRIPGITINGNDIFDYTISVNNTVNASSADVNKTVKYIQETIYEKIGAWLPEVSLSESDDKTITIELTNKTGAGKNGYQIKVDGDTLLIQCAYSNALLYATETYLNEKFPFGVSDTVEFDDYNSLNVTVVKYSDERFEGGAKGDGKTDDFKAIKAVHDYANAGGQTVLGEKGKTYYIGVNPSTISIRTNVDWQGATFIFDDTKLTGSNTKSVFSIDSATGSSYIRAGDKYFDALNTDDDGDGIVIKGINHGDEQTTKLDLGLGYPALLNVNNSSTNMYIRWGSPDGQYHTQEEIILIDAEGNIDPSTPFLCDYEGITSIRVQRLDTIEPITIKNATIISRATKMNNAGNISHGIRIDRSYTTLEGIKHVIEGEFGGINHRNNNSRTPIRYNATLGYWEDVSSEGFTATGGANYKIYKNGVEYTEGDVKVMEGVTYTGIITVSFSDSVTVKDCELQARTYYGGGTYDLNIYNANNAKFINVIQTNFFDTSTNFLNAADGTYANMSLCWGVMGSNYGKNLQFEGCMLTRFDAHCGVYNASMVDTTVSVIRLIGGGDFILDGVTFYYSASVAPIQLRSDYGATFNGTVTIKDTTINTRTNLPGLIDAPSANWDFGYETYCPNVVIDNIKLLNNQTELQIFTRTDPTYSAKNHYPERDVATQKVNDPNAKFTLYYETTDPNLVENKGIRKDGKTIKQILLIVGRKKKDISISQISKLKDNEYGLIDHGNGTYTIVANNVINANVFHAPTSIEVKNMSNFTNASGKKITLKLYTCDFFKNTEIITDGSIKVTRAKP